MTAEKPKHSHGAVEPAADARDHFEQQFMRDGSRVLHRDKHVSRGMAAMLAAPGLFSLALAAFVAAVNSSSDKPLPEAALPVVVAAIAVFGLGFLALAVTFAVLRVVVTEREVHVKYGLWGPSVPLERITSCTVVDYQWTKYGGWGIRRGADGSWAYVAAGGKVVQLTYQEDGEVKKILVGARDAVELARRIQQARGALEGARFADERASENAREDAEAEAEAELEASHASTSSRGVRGTRR